jgi:outer membrane protein assembly factor BamA
LGAAGSLQKPYDSILRLSSNYDFNGHALDSRLGYEIRHIFNTQTAAGFEVFDYESSKEKQDVSGGKIYLRKELWPASYGLLEPNDHVTLYLIRDQKLESSSSLGGQEDARQLYYRRKDEAIVGVSGSIGRYGPYFDPDCGWKFTPSLETAGHFLGAKESFWRTTSELDNYLLISPRHQHKVASKIKFGWGEASDKKLFQLGGPDGLRGFSRKTVEGAHLVLGSLEYRFPIRSDIKLYFPGNIFCLDKVQGVGFFDAGKAWYSDFGGSDFKKDAGLGVRLHFDVLGFLERTVLRIDLAQAIGAPKEKAHLWFGISQDF